MLLPLGAGPLSAELDDIIQKAHFVAPARRKGNPSGGAVRQAGIHL
jgi:hypothetical protein